MSYGEPITPTHIAEWCALYDAGHTFRELAAITRRDAKVIRTAFRAHGITSRRSGPRGPWPVGWCDDCCNVLPLNPVTGWCSDCSSLPRRPTWNHGNAARGEVECGPGSLHSPALVATSSEEATTMPHHTPPGDRREEATA